MAISMAADGMNAVSMLAGFVPVGLLVHPVDAQTQPQQTGLDAMPNGLSAGELGSLPAKRCRHVGTSSVRPKVGPSQGSMEIER